MCFELSVDGLKLRKIWTLWCWASVDGRLTKTPFAASGGPTGADATHAATWTDFATAAAALAAGTVRAATGAPAAGLGFMLPPDIVLLDLDHVDGPDEPVPRRMLDRFGPTYAERSISGTGLHVLGLVDPEAMPRCWDEKSRRWRLAPQHWQRRDGLELYSGAWTGRYCVFTGDAVQDGPLLDVTEAVLETLQTELRKPDTGDAAVATALDWDAPADPAAVALAISEARAAKNGAKFRSLFDDGDTSGYPSASEADFALAEMLAYWLGPHPAAILTAVKMSALNRAKWERGDYARRTIENAIAACAGSFSLAALERSGDLPDFFYRTRQGQLKVDGVRLAAFAREHLQFVKTRDGQFFVYDGGRYAPQTADEMRGRVRALVDGFAPSAASAAAVNEAVVQLTMDLDRCVERDALDTDESIINFANGLLDLGTLALRPHDPEVLSTIKLPIAWSGRAEPTPVFDKYLNDLTGGDRELQRLLLEFVGVAVSNVPGWRFKKALFLVGPGDCGKSVLLRLLAAALGRENVAAASLDALQARFGGSLCYGKRLCCDADMSAMRLPEVSTFKSLTGGDQILCERKGQSGFAFRFDGLLAIAGNQMPQFGGDAGRWVFDRFLVVPCDHVVPEAQRDPLLSEKLVRELPGIVYRAVTAARDVIANGYRLCEPECVRAARRAFEIDNSSVLTFWRDCMAPADGSARQNPTVGDVFTAYQRWCYTSRLPAQTISSLPEFRQKIAAHLGVPWEQLTTRAGGRTHLRGWRLLQAGDGPEIEIS